MVLKLDFVWVELKCVNRNEKIDTKEKQSNTIPKYKTKQNHRWQTTLQCNTAVQNKRRRTHPNRTSSTFGTGGRLTSILVFPLEIAAPTAVAACLAIWESKYPLYNLGMSLPPSKNGISASTLETSSSQSARTVEVVMTLLVFVCFTVCVIFSGLLKQQQIIVVVLLMRVGQ